MIFDHISNAECYYNLGERYQKAFQWLKNVDISTLTPGQRVDIDGDNIYATLFSLDTLPVSESKLEAHRRYADLQYLAQGSERVGYALAGTMEPISEYTDDIQFFNGNWDTLTLHSGDFYLVFPQDLHAPRVAEAAPSHVVRLVVKIKLS